MASPEHSIAVPGHDGVTLHLVTVGDDEVSFYYRGDRDSILALKLVDPQVLAPWKKGTPKGRKDLAGHKVWVYRHFLSRGGVPILCYRLVVVRVPLNFAKQMPGYKEGLAAEARRELVRMEHVRLARQREAMEAAAQHLPPELVRELRTLH